VHRLTNSSTVLERTPFWTTYLTVRISGARVLITIEGRNIRAFQFEGLLSASSEGSSLVGALRPSRYVQSIWSAWFGFLIAGGIYFIYRVLTDSNQAGSAPTSPAALVLFGFIWVGFCLFAYFFL